MIKAKIEYHDNKINALTIHGHAEAGNHGHDLVCAGVSAIMNGAFNAFDQLTPQNVDLEVATNRLAVKVKVNTELVTTMMETLHIQLATIAAQYPQNIQIQEVR